MPEVTKIGIYQLENLLRQAVPFLYLDLRDPGRRERELVGHRLLGGSVSVPVAELAEVALEHVVSLGVPSHHPIVLICENGTKSMAVARLLEQNSFINAFVFEGGTQALGAP